MTKLINFAVDQLRTLLAIFRNLNGKYFSMAWNLPLCVTFSNGKRTLDMLFPFFQKFLSMFTDLPACFSLLHCMYIFMIYALCFIIKWSPTFILRICPFLSVDTVSFLFLPLLKLTCLLCPQKWHLQPQWGSFWSKYKLASGLILKFIHPKLVRYQP